MYKDIIGILGGMGSFATLDIFRRILFAFPAQKEWDRPRIIIDNNCTMPSRVLAITEKKNYHELLAQMSSSIDNLLKSGATKIFLACNTSHYFLPELLTLIPQAKEKIISLIDCCTEDVLQNKASDVYVLASEATISTGLFQKKLVEKAVKVYTPQGNSYFKQREIIEMVKQNNITKDTKKMFFDIILEGKSQSVILGCTEFSILGNQFQKDLQKMDLRIYDPIESVINKLKKECR